MLPRHVLTVSAIVAGVMLGAAGSSLEARANSLRRFEPFATPRSLLFAQLRRRVDVVDRR
jgi:hypothetical protein